jgi:hypothetical protein
VALWSRQKRCGWRSPCTDFSPFGDGLLKKFALRYPRINRGLCCDQPRGVHAKGKRIARGSWAPARQNATVLVVLVALGMVLLSGAGLLIRIFQGLRSVNPGSQTPTCSRWTCRGRACCAACFSAWSPGVGSRSPLLPTLWASQIDPSACATSGSGTPFCRQELSSRASRGSWSRSKRVFGLCVGKQKSNASVGIHGAEGNGKSFKKCEHFFFGHFFSWRGY